MTSALICGLHAACCFEAEATVRTEMMVFRVITGATGSDPILADLPDIDLEFLESRLLDGRVLQLVYVPTIPADW